MSRHTPKPPKPLPTTREDGPTVTVAWISPGQVESRFMASMMGMLLYEIGRGANTFSANQTYIEMTSSPRIAEARTQVVHEFLKGNADYLLMVDADMTWERDALERMLAHADPVERPVIGGLCFAGGRGSDVIYPTIYEKVMVRGLPAPQPVADFPSERVPRNQLIRVFGTGAACLLVHRSVFIKLAKSFPKLANGRPNPYPWFVEGTTHPDGGALGEDIAFCMKLDVLDIPLHVHTGIEFGHIKSRELNSALYMKERGRGNHR